ncbi:MAG: ATP-binding cassette domain-containing protein, partial [Candidatus Methanoperedens sp.]|nr:ATP-binding cassette domain-containing protein [Candidatus Methanoperedens sp.]
SGEARVCGYDIIKDAKKVRNAISYVPQGMAVDIKLTGYENVMLYAKLYGVPDRKRKVDEVLELMGLSERKKELVRNYSGGMRRRLELAQALVHEPEVLFLDEPTLGLDVAGRRHIWEHISSLKKKGMTIFMTTHYMDEADEFCDRVAIIDKGRIAAMDSPAKLKNMIGKNVITASVKGEFKGLNIDGIKFLSSENGELKFKVENGSEALPVLSEALSKQGLKVHALLLREPSMDDVFMQNVSTQDDKTRFDSNKFRTMLRGMK